MPASTVLLPAVRAAAALVLATLVCTAFLLVVVERAVTGKLLNDRFYADLLVEHNSYRLLYDRVLVDDRVLQFVTSDLFPGTEESTYLEWVGVARDILPPDSLQRHSENALARVSNYMTSDARDLWVYLEFRRDLERVGPTVLRLIGNRIDDSPISVDIDPDCSAAGARELADEFHKRALTFAVGNVPGSIPSLDSLPTSCREAVFLLVHEGLVQRRGLDSRSAEWIASDGPEIRRKFLAGDSRGAMKSIVVPWVSPFIDDSVFMLQEELDSGITLELVGKLAPYGGEPLARDLQRVMSESRQWVNRGTGLARTVGWPVVVGGAFLQVLVYWPRIFTGVRWLGVTLMVAGGISLSVGKLAPSVLAGRVRLLVDMAAGRIPDFPTSLNGMISEIAVPFVRELPVVDTTMSVVTLGVGTVLYTLSVLPWAMPPPAPDQESLKSSTQRGVSEQGDGVDGGPGDVSELQRPQG